MGRVPFGLPESREAPTARDGERRDRDVSDWTKFDAPDGCVGRVPRARQSFRRDRAEVMLYRVEPHPAPPGCGCLTGRTAGRVQPGLRVGEEIRIRRRVGGKRSHPDGERHAVAGMRSESHLTFDALAHAVGDDERVRLGRVHEEHGGLETDGPHDVGRPQHPRDTTRDGRLHLRKWHATVLGLDQADRQVILIARAALDLPVEEMTGLGFRECAWSLAGLIRHRPVATVAWSSALALRGV